ncbi:hypothetical protein D9M72_478880 [compost metagenome]
MRLRGAASPRCATLHACWAKALPTRASRRRTALPPRRACRQVRTACAAASPARTCRPRPSSASCRTTTRPATAQWATGWPAWRTATRCAQRWRCSCCARRCRWCSWARKPARSGPSSTSPVTRPNWHRPCATAGAASLRLPRHSATMRAPRPSPIPTTRPPSRHRAPSWRTTATGHRTTTNCSPSAAVNCWTGWPAASRPASISWARPRCVHAGG